MRRKNVSRSGRGRLQPVAGSSRLSAGAPRNARLAAIYFTFRNQLTVLNKKGRIRNTSGTRNGPMRSSLGRLVRA